MPRMYPVKNRIKVAGHIPFGGADTNAKYGRHAGDDSANPAGTEVYAPTDGVVTSYKWSKAHGHIVEIFDGTNYPHVFHLSQRLVSDGQRVKAGELVGRSGNTGLSTGPHVHFGVSKKSVPNVTSFNDFIDPMEWLKQGEEMIDLNLARQQADAQWGWSITPERDAILQRDIVGRETNEAINFMYNHPWGVNWRTYRNQLQQFWNDYHNKIASGKLDDDDAEMQAALVELNKAKELLQKAIED